MGEREWTRRAVGLLVFLGLYLPSTEAGLVARMEGAANQKAVDRPFEAAGNEIEPRGPTTRKAGLLAAAEGGAFPSPPTRVDFLAVSDTVDRIPPDTQGAVSRERVLTTLNTSVRLQTRQGATLHTESLARFWRSLDSPDPFDPRSTYDPYRDRWIFTSCANLASPEAALLVAVSQTSDPAGNWNYYRFDADEGLWFDFPSLGFNRKWVGIQVLMKTSKDREVAETRLLLFDKEDLYSGGEGRFTQFRTDWAGVVLAPAVTLDPDLETLYVAHCPTDAPTAESIGLHAIRGEVGAEEWVDLGRFGSDAPWATAPPGVGNIAPQRGSRLKIHLQNSRALSAVYRNGSVWCAHHIFLPADAPSRSAIQWWELSPVRVLQRGRIDDPSGGRFYGYPSLAVNRWNDMLIGYSRFAADEHPSAAYSFRLGSDPLGQTRSSRLLKAGEGVYFKDLNTGKNRWGDFSATLVDPVDDTAFWTIQEYSLPPEGDPNLDATGRWSTWWGQVAPEFEEVDLRVTVSPSTETVRIGDPLTYTVAVVNAGPDTATDVAVTHRLSPGLLFGSASSTVGNCEYAADALTCRAPALAPGAEMVMTIESEVHSGTVFDYEAEVRSFERDLNVENNIFRDRVVLEGSDIDSDADGLPDEWEVAHGFNPNNAQDAGLDPDADGHSNWEEFRARTDPRDAKSVLLLSAAAGEGDGVELRFFGAKGVLYRIERASSLPASEWTPFREAEGEDGELRFADSAASNGSERYYRLRIVE